MASRFGRVVDEQIFVLNARSYTVLPNTKKATKCCLTAFFKAISNE